VELCLHSPNAPSWRGAQLKHRDNFTSTCHHDKTRALFADGGDSFHIWRVVANVLNVQSWTVDKAWYSRLGMLEVCRAG